MKKTILATLVLISFAAKAGDCKSAGIEVESSYVYGAPNPTTQITHSSCNLWLFKNDADLYQVDQERIQALVDKGYFPNVINESELNKKVQLGDLVGNFQGYDLTNGFCYETHLFGPDELYPAPNSNQWFNLKQVIRAGDQPLFKKLAASSIRTIAWQMSAGDAIDAAWKFTNKYIPTCKVK